jgi:F0F1-type ATP synthase B chain
MFMLSEEYIEREKRLAELYERYYDSRPELKKALDELYDLFENEKISFKEFRERALEAGKKYG